MSARRASLAPLARGGFTLLEVMIAIGILAGISAAMFIIFANSSRLQETSNHKAELSSMGQIAMARMEREIGLAFLSANKKAQPAGAGDNPDDTFETIFYAEDADPFDKLHFTSRSHRKLYRDSKECSLTEISYFEETDDQSRYFKLMHREEERIDGEPTEGGQVMVLARSVKKLNFRYFDDQKNEWLEEWDTLGADELNRLPRAVEVTLVIADDEGEEMTWVNKIMLTARNN